MPICEKIIETKDYLTKSNLPASDYVINPYVGCPHGCRYCYASFMKRFTGHTEPWGSFVDIKHCEKPINTAKLKNKSVFMSSVTDCYNPFEEKYCVTQNILRQLAGVDCELTISTKSGLILRDLALLKQCKHLTVSMSINTLDEQLRSDMDKAAPIAERLHTLEALHGNGIRTVLFLSPMFPELTDYRHIIERSRPFVDEYWFENLNLRGGFKKEILDYIRKKYPQYADLYETIYQKGDRRYWVGLAQEIEDYCAANAVAHKNYFYHEKLVQQKATLHAAADVL